MSTIYFATALDLLGGLLIGGAVIAAAVVALVWAFENLLD